MTHNADTPIYKEVLGTCLVEIYDTGDCRSLYFGGRYLQSRMSLNSPQLLILPYTHYMMFTLLLTDVLEHVLLIGIGAGSLVRFIHHHFPNCSIDAVDCSDHIIKLAKGYFQLPDNNHVHIHCQDGRQFISRLTKEQKYDLILVDAFDEKGMSEQVYTRQFFHHCIRALKKTGILCSNLWSGDPEKIEEISDALSSCFKNRLLLPVPDRGNIIGIATVTPVEWRKVCRCRSELRHLQTKFQLDFQKMVRIALQHNMSFGQRLLHFFLS